MKFPYYLLSSATLTKPTNYLFT